MLRLGPQGRREDTYPKLPSGPSGRGEGWPVHTAHRPRPAPLSSAPGGRSSRAALAQNPRKSRLEPGEWGAVGTEPGPAGWASRRSPRCVSKNGGKERRRRACRVGPRWPGEWGGGRDSGPLTRPTASLRLSLSPCPDPLLPDLSSPYTCTGGPGWGAEQVGFWGC